MAISNFYDLDAWQKSHQLVLDIYKITEKFPEREVFGITNQLRRAVTSVTANIAEGFERFHFNDKARFYYQARGSAGEVQNFLILSKDLGFINQKDLDILEDNIGMVRRLINGLIKSIKKQK